MLQGENSSILSTFIKIPFFNKILVWSIFEWMLKTGLTIYVISSSSFFNPLYVDELSSANKCYTDGAVHFISKGTQIGLRNYDVSLTLILT